MLWLVSEGRLGAEAAISMDGWVRSLQSFELLLKMLLKLRFTSLHLDEKF